MLRIRLILLTLLCFAGGQEVLAQPWDAIGMRFATYVNWHPRPARFNLIQGSYTTGVIGAYYKRFSNASGLELGLNLNYKNGDDRGFPNLPVIMTDYGPVDTQSVGITAIETELKVGPRIGYLHPKFGYVIGYSFQRTGLLENAPSDWSVNRFYFLIPVGASFDLPTRYGSVGFGAYFFIGLLNVVSEPPNNAGNWEGGRLRTISLEITASFDNRN